MKAGAPAPVPRRPRRACTNHGAQTHASRDLRQSRLKSLGESSLTSPRPRGAPAHCLSRISHASSPLFLVSSSISSYTPSSTRALFSSTPRLPLSARLGLAAHPPGSARGSSSGFGRKASSAPAPTSANLAATTRMIRYVSTQPSCTLKYRRLLVVSFITSGTLYPTLILNIPPIFPHIGNPSRSPTVAESES